MENKTVDFLKEVPKHYEAEQALLGAILVNNRAFEKVSDFLLESHFSDDTHRKIYKECFRLISEGKLADPLTLKIRFEQLNQLGDIGGFDYLVKLAGVGISAVNAGDYGRLIFDAAIRRNLIDIGQEITKDAFDHVNGVPGTEQIEVAEQRLFDLATTGESQGDLVQLKSPLNVALEKIEYAYKKDGSTTGISTGITAVDNATGGMHPSDLVIVAARPGMGKTNLALSFAINAANEVLNKRAPHFLTGPVAFFSLEMSQDQLAMRLLSSQAEISGDKMRKGNVNEDEISKLSQYAIAMANLPIYIDDTPGISVPAIRTRARRLKSRQGLSMIIIDYIQLLSSPGGAKDNRVQEVSEITRGLKLLAKDLQVPVIALSQLNRSVEQRTDKRPLLADLRESGSIEQDADMVMFVYREVYYLKNNPPSTDDPEKFAKWHERVQKLENKAELIIGKQRHGPTGTVDMAFIGEYSKFSDWYEGEK